MKVFNLRCNFGHDFEGWFGSMDDFDRQRQNHLLCCPVCESASVERLPSAPHLSLGPRAVAGQPAPGPTSAGHANMTAHVAGADGVHPAQAAWMQAVRELTETVLTNTEDVGERFVEEARRIHYREAPERGIRGVATEQQRAELEEEGISVLSVPLLPVFKQTLQ
jgi:hypothetical protein